MFKQIVSRTKRVPAMATSIPGNGEAMTRQLDTALMSVGWKLSADLYRDLAGRPPSLVKDMADRLLPLVNELVGNHVEHNVYFKEFPKNIPDTEEFWMGLIREGLADQRSSAVVAAQVALDSVNLLDLPSYGKYLHSYEEMVKHHEEFIPDLKKKFKVLHLGKSLQEETVALYHQLAGSAVPLNLDDRVLISELTKMCLDERQPDRFPVRENKAVVNSVRLENKRPILADTVTDVLRVAVAFSGGDVTLDTKTKFKSFPRSVRRTLLSTLSGVLQGADYKLMDVNRHPEMWKRLGEKLHPHEFGDPAVRDLFAVARGDKRVVSLAAQVEVALNRGDFDGAVRALFQSPGTLFRSLDRMVMILENCVMDVAPESLERFLVAVRSAAPRVSGRVLIGAWEHLLNGTNRPVSRLFANSKGTIWTEKETRKNLPTSIVSSLISVIKAELRARFWKMGIDGLTVDPDALRVALPLSEKNKSSGFGVLPKGSVVPVRGDTLRFFIYWKQHSARTDYDLAAFFMNENFRNDGHCSWTNLRHGGSADADAVHSGDITDATNGASEFIDMKLGKVKAPYIVAQINRYAGENYQDVEENFFGFMERTEAQKGKPFEPKTVKVKSEVRGKGQVAIPALFFRDSSGSWNCKWLDFQLAGAPSMNRIEENKVTTSMLMEAAMKRTNLTIKDLVELLPGTTDPTRMAYVGFLKPDGQEANHSKVFTLDNITRLIPE